MSRSRSYSGRPHRRICFEEIRELVFLNKQTNGNNYLNPPPPPIAPDTEKLLDGVNFSIVQLPGGDTWKWGIT